MRYFFISYAHDKGFGTMELQLDSFPNHEGVMKTIKDQDPSIESVTVISIFEFKTEADFKQWMEQ